MSVIQLHLLINHFPLIVPIVALLLLFWGLFKKSEVLMQACLGLFVLTAFFTWGAVLTGDPAADAVKLLPGFERSYIREHDHAADFALISSIVTGVMSLVLIWGLKKKRDFTQKRWSWSLLIILSLWSISVAARTSHLGGLIRHDEIRQK